MIINTMVVFAFFCILGYTILNAYGYRIDTDNIGFVHTGVLDLRSIKNEYQITLDDEILEEETPVMLGELDIKKTNLKLSDSGFHDWEKTVRISPRVITPIFSIRLIPIMSTENTTKLAENVKSFTVHEDKTAILTQENKIILLENPAHPITPPSTDGLEIDFCGEKLCITDAKNTWQINPDNTLTKSEKANEAQVKFSPNGQKILTVKGQEIWIKTIGKNQSNLVARYSKGLTDAAWYSDNQILISRNGELYVQDLDGQNIYKISDIDDRFEFQNKKIYFAKDGNLMVIDTK